MKLQNLNVLALLLTIISGCTQNALVQRLKVHGVTENNTTRLRFISSEGAFGSDIKVTVSDGNTIEKVWSSIKCAKPTKLWYVSGDHRIEFFTPTDSEIPAATVLLNVSDGAHLEGDLWYHLDSNKNGYYGLWKCTGLNELVMFKLRNEYERRQAESKQYQPKI
jgi:hypothetical protein